MLLLVISSAVLALTADRLARAALGGDVLGRTLATFVLAPAAVISVTLVVGGALSAYRPVPLTAGSVGVGLAMLLGAHVVGRRGSTPAAIDAAALDSGALADVDPEPDADPARRRGRSVEALAVGVLAVVVVGALASRAVLAAALPNNAYDALAYHVPAIAEWVRAGEVGPTDVTRALCCPWYPSSGEAWAGWEAPFLHSSRFIAFGQLWFAIVVGLAGAVLARSWGASPRYIAVAGLLVTGMPIVLAQSNAAYVDLTFAGALLSAYAFAVLAADRASTSAAAALGPALVAGIALGVALGTKGTGLVAAPLCGVVLAVLLARRLGRRAVPSIVVAATAALALGVPWYAAAWASTGNPITPYELEVGGVEVFDGSQSYRRLTPPPSQVAALPGPLGVARSWLEDLRVAAPGFKYVVDQRAGGFGAVFTLLGLPGLAWLLLARRHRRAEVLLVVAGVALLLVVQPYAWWSRFTITFGAVALVAGACALQRLPRRVRAAGLVALVPLVALPALKVSVGDSAITARYGRGAIARHAPGWIVDQPSTASLLPRFAPLDDAPGPVLVDRRIANRTVGVVVEPGLRRRVEVEPLTPANLRTATRRADAATVVLDRAVAASWPSGTLAAVGTVSATTDELTFLRVTPSRAGSAPNARERRRRG